LPEKAAEGIPDFFLYRKKIFETTGFGKSEIIVIPES
jgi:hypothetical protein